MAKNDNFNPAAGLFSQQNEETNIESIYPKSVSNKKGSEKSKEPKKMGRPVSQDLQNEISVCTISIKMSTEMLKEIKIYAATENKDLGFVIREAIRTYLK